MCPVLLHLIITPWPNMVQNILRITALHPASLQHGQFKKKANLRDLIAATGLVILLKFDSNHLFFSPCDLEICWRTLKNNRAPLVYYVKLCASFQGHWWIQTGVRVPKRSIPVKIGNFLSGVTLKFDIWPWKQRVASSTLRQALCIISKPLVNSNWCYRPKTPHLGQNRRFFSRVTLKFDDLKDNMTPLLSSIKLCASFHRHMRIQTWVTVRKPLNWVLTSVTLTFCMGITSVVGDNCWKFHYHTMMGT